MSAGKYYLHFVVVDDTDPAIRYGPVGWFTADPGTLTAGNFGPIYNGTSHATSSASSSISFNFTGSALIVRGSLVVTTDANNVTDPTWACFVDGIQIPQVDSTFKYPENNWELCSQDTITPGPHNLTIQVQSKGQGFYLDGITYTPTPNTTFESATTTIYKHLDAAITYDSNWANVSGEHVTQTTNAQASLSFHGTSVTLFGNALGQYPGNVTSASYTIDGGPPVAFNVTGKLNPADGPGPVRFNLLLFTTPALTNGPHTLVITHGGDIDHAPLFVGAFYVTATNAPSSSKRGISAGTITGAVVGAVVFLASLLATFYLCRRKRRRRDADAEKPTIEPYSSPPAERSSVGKRGVNCVPATVPDAVPVRPARKVGVAAITPPTVRQHEDSGARASHSNAPAPIVVELPPNYTPN
ncbi:hypothetical protein B0H16DRAFT_1418692 [Mycena metata]|uniref:Transmembrane protein n=1 Tax=Mycena metata TaxID=1033252 RepID=A0AAD7IYZ8_9AGAR|nr:hypothetical protein B0H16DRAFT_1418692 [Mycena metata]